jgi:hypothetical protein
MINKHLPPRQKTQNIIRGKYKGKWIKVHFGHTNLLVYQKKKEGKWKNKRVVREEGEKQIKKHNK